MLFNSYEFIFIFLPLVLAGFFFLKPKYRIGFLITASIVFYAQWSTAHLMLLMLSIVCNYLFSLYIVREKRYKALILTAAVLTNLLPLIYFKYSFFLHFSKEPLLLPLAISFYTFQQIAYQVDVYKKKVKPDSFKDYLFFVMFFPQLIAGPIVHYREIITQVKDGAVQNANRVYMQAGLLFFSLGLFKKVVLADQLFPVANEAFTHLDTLTTLWAWTGLLAYSLGIYFDFSGYSDMAVGLGLLFGFRLPFNFYSPYRAVDISAFWRRWHITLSDFLKTYIYIPLGGNRKGTYREVGNLIVTMTLAGIWHGSGWTFMLWGLMHGLLLAALHLKKRHFPRWQTPKTLSVLLTFTAVTLLWVIFRSQNMEEAGLYYAALFAFDGGSIPALDIYFVMAGLGIVWFLPNSVEFTGYDGKMKAFGRRYALAAALLAFAALKMMAEAPAQTFVYFNF